MRKLLLISILFCWVFNSQSQDYVFYYETCNYADSLRYVGKKEEALKKYKEAFATVDYVHSEKLYKASYVSAELNKLEEAYNFAKQAMIHSGNPKIYLKDYKAFRKSKYYRQLKDSTESFLTIFNKRIDHKYISIIDSLDYIDQYIIRGNKSKRYKKMKYQIDESQLPENRFDLDSSNWALLYQLIHERGFPSEQNIGSEKNLTAWYVLHHNLRLKENEKYHQEIFGFIRKGETLPRENYFWYEQYQQIVHGTTFFTTWDGNLSPENIVRINENRKKFYLKSLNSFELKKDGRFMSSIW